MSHRHFAELAIDAINADDLTRLKEALARGQQLLQDYVDVPLLVGVLEREIAKIENAEPDVADAGQELTERSAPLQPPTDFSP